MAPPEILRRLKDDFEERIFRGEQAISRAVAVEEERVVGLCSHSVSPTAVSGPEFRNRGLQLYLRASKSQTDLKGLDLHSPVNNFVGLYPLLFCVE